MSDGGRRVPGSLDYRAFVEVDPDTEGFSEKLQAALEEATADARASVPVGADIEPLKAKIDEAKADLDELDGERAEPQLSADIEQLKAAFDEADAKLAEFGGETAEATLGADKEPLDEKVEAAKADLAEIDGTKATATITADDDPAKAAIADLQAELAILRLRKQGFTIDADASEAEIKIAALEAQITALKEESESFSVGDIGGGGSGGSPLESFPGGMMGGIGAGLAALSPGIGGAATGLGLLGGTGFLAMDGIFKAVSAAHQATQQQQQYSEQLAATEFQDSVQIQQAQQAIGAAHMQAAEDAANSAQQIITAEQAVGQAEHGLADAQYSEQQAQVALTEARIQARLTLQQLEDQVKEASLAEQGASLALQQAQYQQTLTDQNAYSTLLDREQASLAVKQAQEQLTLAQQGSSNATMEASSQNRQYFDGQQQVIQAEHALSDAQYGVQQATQQVADAVRNLALTRSNAADTSERDALAVQQAEQNLTNTYKQQSLAMQEMKAASPFGQFERDMALLSPAGREVAREIIRMGGGLRILEHIAQTAIAPGVLIFLRGVRSLWPEVKTGVKEMGGAISAAFGQFGKQMQTPAFAKVLDGLIRNGITFVNTVLPAFATFIQQLAITGSKSNAIGGLAGLLAGIANAMTGIVKGLTPYTGQLTQFWAALARGAGAAAPLIGRLAGLLGSGLGTAIVALVPAWVQLMTSMSPFISMVAGVLRALSPLAPVLTLVAEATVLPLTAFAQLAKAWDDNSASIGKAVSDMWNNYIKPVFEFIVNEGIKPLESAALYLWHNVFQPVFNGIASAAQSFVSHFGTVWNAIKGVFESPVNFLINTVYDNGIRRFWDDVVGAIGLSSLKMPYVAPLAGGGVIPGYSPGHDSVPALLSPGEGVLTPQAVQGIGPGAVHALNDHFSNSSGGMGSSLAKSAAKMPVREALRHVTERPAMHMLGFGSGGIVGDVGGFVSGIGHDILGAAKGAYSVARMVAALSTGNTTALSNALDAFIRAPGASGDLAKVMTGLPKALISKAVGQIASFGGGAAGGISRAGPVSGSIASWFAQAVKLAGVPASWIPDLETIARYESSFNPNAINLTDSNAAAGDPSRGIMQEIMTTFLGYHVPGTSDNIYDPVANIASASRYIRSRYGSVYNVPGIVSLSHGGGYVGYDSGGWMPSMPAGMPVNTTGQPEAVLSPEVSQAFVTWVTKQFSGQSGGAAGPQPMVNNFIYNGTQYPTPEQKAMQLRDLAMTLGG